MIEVDPAQIDRWAGAVFWPFVRFLALLMSAPLLSHRAVPARVKIALAFACALLVAPALDSPPLSSPYALALLVQQIMIGVALGFALQIVFAGVQFAGDLMGLQMGLSFATFIDPQTQGQSPLVGTFLGLLALLVFLAIDGHLAMIETLAASFAALPIDPMALPALDWRALAAWGGSLFSLGLHIALPVLAAMLACNLALAVLVRAAPQLNLFSIGFPVTLVVGFLLLAVALPWLAPLFESSLRDGFELWRSAR